MSAILENPSVAPEIDDSLKDTPEINDTAEKAEVFPQFMLEAYDQHDGKIGSFDARRGMEIGELKSIVESWANGESIFDTERYDLYKKTVSGHQEYTDLYEAYMNGKEGITEPHLGRLAAEISENMFAVYNFANFQKARTGQAERRAAFASSDADDTASDAEAQREEQQEQEGIIREVGTVDDPVPVETDTPESDTTTVSDMASEEIVSGDDSADSEDRTGSEAPDVVHSTSKDSASEEEVSDSESLPANGIDTPHADTSKTEQENSETSETDNENSNSVQDKADTSENNTSSDSDQPTQQAEFTVEKTDANEESPESSPDIWDRPEMKAMVDKAKADRETAQDERLNAAREELDKMKHDAEQRLDDIVNQKPVRPSEATVNEAVSADYAPDTTPKPPIEAPRVIPAAPGTESSASEAPAVTSENAAAAAPPAPEQVSGLQGREFLAHRLTQLISEVRAGANPNASEDDLRKAELASRRLTELAKLGPNAHEWTDAGHKKGGFLGKLFGGEKGHEEPKTLSEAQVQQIVNGVLVAMGDRVQGTSDEDLVKPVTEKQTKRSLKRWKAALVGVGLLTIQAGSMSVAPDQQADTTPPSGTGNTELIGDRPTLEKNQMPELTVPTPPPVNAEVTQDVPTLSDETADASQRGQANSEPAVPGGGELTSAAESDTVAQSNTQEVPAETSPEQSYEDQVWNRLNAEIQVQEGDHTLGLIKKALDGSPSVPSKSNPSVTSHDYIASIGDEVIVNRKEKGEIENRQLQPGPAVIGSQFGESGEKLMRELIKISGEENFFEQATKLVDDWRKQSR